MKANDKVKVKRRWKCSGSTPSDEATREQGRQDHDARRTHGSTSIGPQLFPPFFVHTPPSIFYVFFWFVKELSFVERTFRLSRCLPFGRDCAARAAGAASNVRQSKLKAAVVDDPNLLMLFIVNR